jgi:ribosome-binding factor A
VSRPSYPRVRRINSVLREVLADAVEDLKDPRLDFVTVTGVESSPDMRHAVVFFSAVDLSTLDDIQTALEAAGPRLRRAVAAQVRMKYVPALEFRVDRGVVEGERIEAILRSLHEEE